MDWLCFAAETTDISVISQLIGSLGVSGVLAWYCWYVTSTTLPRLQDAFREENRLLREHYSATIDRVLAEHKDESGRLAEAVEHMVTHCSGRTGPS